jgi:ElaB/YqjD/DUF883 family membrane-anchored ribosome-binding protein
MTASASTPQTSRQAADSMLHSAENAVDSTRSSANHALDMTQDKMQNLSSGFRPALEKLSHRAENYAHQGIDKATQAKDKARESLSHYSAATSRYVADKPVQSVMIAAAVGAALALLVSVSRNRN